MFALVLTALTLVLLATIYLFLRSRQRFWSNRGFPHVPNPHILYGHAKGQVTSRHASYISMEVYRKFKQRGDPFGGFNFSIIPAVMIIDPELIKTVMVRDFHVFHDHGIYHNPKADPLSGHLFFLEGAPWRVLRQKLAPTFTSSKMKMMYDAIQAVAEELRRFMDEAYLREHEIEMKDVLAKFTTDVIGTCIFGLDCNSLTDPNSEFLKYGKKIFEQTLFSHGKFVFATLFKECAKALGVRITDIEVEKFFLGITRETVKYREKNNVQRKDFMDVLMKLKRKEGSAGKEVEGLEEEGLTVDEMAAQFYVFFIAGYETSSSTMNFCLYELAMNQEIQDRLREEIQTAIAANGGHVTYELVMGLQYLDNVVNETLRKYPPLESLFRVPNRDYTFPGTKHVIPKGTMVQIPAYAVHHDADIYPDPERFDPDRFLPEVVASRPSYTFLSFGEGPRICIGVRFGMMQTKTGLIALLRNFRFSPSARTPTPIVYDPKTFVLSPQGGNYLRFDKI